MSTDAQAAALPASREKIVLFSLAAVQFTHVLDFMVMMPLGSQLMRVFSITPAQFSLLLTSYSIAAALTGFAAGFVMDRFDRKRALLFLYAGFGLGTLACALAPNYFSLLAARTLAGAFGGVAGSIVTAAVGDLIPPNRRGAAMGLVMSAFPLASALGVPLGLLLANQGDLGWHAPFFLLAGLCPIVLAVIARTLPALPPHAAAAKVAMVSQMQGLLSHPNHLRAFALTLALIGSGSLVIPFMAPSMVANVGLREDQLFLIYLCGGLATMVSTYFFGRLSDRHDKLHVLTAITSVAVAVVVIMTHLSRVPMPVALVVSTAFMVFVSGRFAPAMAMITNSIEARYRGGFMSVNSALQQAAAGACALVAGQLVKAEAQTGRLVGYPTVGWISAAVALLTLWLAYRLRAAVPESSRVLPVASGNHVG